eukprot:scaffold11355_cov81-Skeletonema_marinoi.AAC.1
MRQERPYNSDSTASRLLSEVKHCRARFQPRPSYRSTIPIAPYFVSYYLLMLGVAVPPLECWNN